MRQNRLRRALNIWIHRLHSSNFLSGMQQLYRGSCLKELHPLPKELVVACLICHYAELLRHGQIFFLPSQHHSLLLWRLSLGFWHICLSYDLALKEVRESCRYFFSSRSAKVLILRIRVYQLIGLSAVLIDVISV